MQKMLLSWWWCLWWKATEETSCLTQLRQSRILSSKILVWSFSSMALRRKYYNIFPFKPVSALSVKPQTSDHGALNKCSAPVNFGRQLHRGTREQRQHWRKSLLLHGRSQLPPFGQSERENKPVSHYGHSTNAHAHCLILSEVLRRILPSKTWNQQETEMVYGLHAAAAGHKPAHSQQQLNLVQKRGPKRRDALHHQARRTICFSFFPPFLPLPFWKAQSLPR